MNCCICGPVKNCGPYLSKVLDNMTKIGSLFDDYVILIYYDESIDNTLQLLREYQLKNPKLLFYVNKQPTSRFRTHNIAKARNTCLEYIRNNRDRYPYFIMMDCDDVNCKDVHIDVLRKYLHREDEWDGLSFNTYPKYYDIWGLSIYPYCFSYNHFHNNTAYYTIIQRYVDALLTDAKREDKLVECISSFNGFSLYKTSKFIHSYYDGRIRLDLMPKQYIDLHKRITNSTKLVFKKYITVDGRHEDCEHRAFHIQAYGAKIMISPDVLFV